MASEGTTASMSSSSSSSSSSTMSVLVQKASQQYLECRRKVTAKVEETKGLDREIQTLFQQIAALTEAEYAEVDGDASKKAKAKKKSVGKLEVVVVEVDGAAPVPGARILLEMDDEDDEDAEEAGEPEAKTETETETDAETETETDKAEEKSGTEAKEETGEKPPVLREVRWDDGAAFPATFVFEQVPSRESVVTISVLPAKKEGESEEEVEPVKEVELSISSLLASEPSGKIDTWYVVKEVQKKIIRTKTTTVRKVKKQLATVPEQAQLEVPSPEGEEKAEEKPAEETEAPAAEKADNAKEQADKDAPAQAEAPAAVAAPAPEAATENPDDVQVHVEKVEETVVVATRFHVQATFMLSEVERLSHAAVALSKKKQEAEAALAVLDREAASLRTKYERLNASQRALSASAATAKSRVASLLGAANARKEKSRFQKMKESMSAMFTPQRRQLLLSGAMFVGSVALFHFQGQNLLA